MDATFWNNRYAGAGDDFVYGTEPNDFLAAHASHIERGPVLCLAEGEGRNAVHVATLGHKVTAVDQSEVALSKAQRLACTRGVAVDTIAADLTDFAIAPGAWGAIVAIWAHMLQPLRRDVHARCVRGLAPGGVFILEAYTPAQLRYDTGGPRNIEALMTLAALRTELVGLELIIAREIERDVHEGTGHGGWSAVVQILARRPS